MSKKKHKTKTLKDSFNSLVKLLKKQKSKKIRKEFTEQLRADLICMELKLTGQGKDVIKKKVFTEDEVPVLDIAPSPAVVEEIKASVMVS